MMDKKTFLENMAKSLRHVPDDATVKLQGPVAICFERNSVAVARITIDETEILADHFTNRRRG